jgi:hypothetical protein
LRKPAGLCALGLALLAALACGRALNAEPGAAAPAASGPSAPSPTSSAPATPPVAGMVVTGALSLQVEATHPSGACGAVPGGFVADLQFDNGGRPWAVSIELPDYSRPGAYPAPPGRVSLRTAGYGNGSPVFYSGASGTVTVDSTGRAGTIDEQLTGEGGTARLAGSWRCG